MRTKLLVAALLIATCVVGLPARPASAITLPPNFTDTLIASVGGPTAIAFTPDGRMLVTTQGGQLRIVKNGALLATPAVNLAAKLCANSERGLLGAAVDPLFTTNGFVYLYYTFARAGQGVCPTTVPFGASHPVNRVSRFVLGAGDVINPATEVVLIDNIPSTAGNHNAGDVAFGSDGLLYITVGDGGCDYLGGGCAGTNDVAREQNVLLGKVLRITRDGAIPSGNPWQAGSDARCNTTGFVASTARCMETFAWGLRNPFRFAFDPNTAGRFFINDVGQNQWEEIDNGVVGADYEWNDREGHCPNGATTNCNAPGATPNLIHDYGRTTGCASITGGAFVPNGAWSAAYDGDYLFADYVCGKIFRLEPAGGGTWNRTDFATGLGGSSAVHLEFGPAGSGQALYYTTYASGGQVRRISFVPPNGSPTASFTPTPSNGPAPLTVSFNGSASSDPEGQALTYSWQFGDGTSATTSTPTTSHTYAAGTFLASLTVTDTAGGTSAPDTKTITASAPGNTPPTPVITSPAAGARFRVGGTITLAGSATDAQDGPLAANLLSWQVLRVHTATGGVSHTHPYFSGTGTNLTFSAPAPEDMQATGTGNHLEVRLTATDSQGASATVTRVLEPNRVTLTFATTPVALTVSVNGASAGAPMSVVSWEGWQLTIGTPSKQGKYRFSSWSDGGASSHVITTPATATTYTASFSGKGRDR